MCTLKSIPRAGILFLLLAKLSLPDGIVNSQDRFRPGNESEPNKELNLDRIAGTWHFTEEQTLKPRRDELTFRRDGTFELKTGGFQFWKFYAGTVKREANGILLLTVTKKRTEFFEETTNHNVKTEYRVRLGTDLSGNLMLQDVTSYPKLNSDEDTVGRIETIGDDSVVIVWRKLYASQKYESKASRAMAEILRSVQKKQEEERQAEDKLEDAIESLQSNIAFGTSILEEDGQPNWGYILGKQTLLQSVIRDKAIRDEIFQIRTNLAAKQASILKKIKGDDSIFAKRSTALIKTNIKIELAEKLNLILMTPELTRIAIAARVEFLKGNWLSDLLTKNANAKLLELTDLQISLLEEIKVRCQKDLEKTLLRIHEFNSDERALKRSLDTRFLEALDQDQRYAVDRLVGDYLNLALSVQDLQHKDPEKRISAALCLADVDSRSTLPELKKRIDEEKNSEVKLALHLAIACQGEKTSAEFLIASMKKSHDAVSYMAKVAGRNFGYSAVNYQNWLDGYSNEEFANLMKWRRIAYEEYDLFSSVYSQVQNGFLVFRENKPKSHKRQPTSAESRVLKSSRTAQAWQLYARAIDVELGAKGNRMATAGLLARIIEEFPDTFYVEPARELLQQLRVMIKEDSKFRMRSDFHLLPLEKKVAFHIHNLRNLQTFDFLGSADPTNRTYNPGAALVAIGDKAIPYLEALHSDKRPIRKSTADDLIIRRFHTYPQRVVRRYSDAAAAIIRKIQADEDGPIIIE